MDKTIKDYVIHASAMYLTTYLPNNYDQIDEAELNEWVESHAHETYQYWDGGTLLLEIQECANHWHQLLSEANG